MRTTRRSHLRHALAAIAAGCAAMPALAATLFDNANGYTLDARGRLVRFSAMAVGDDGRILAVGNARKVAAAAPGAARVDLRGRTVLPGLIDAHGHVFSLGSEAAELNLRATRTLDEARAAIADYAARHPQHAWIRGGAWNQAVWKLDRFPTARDIDGVVADRPVWLYRVDGHAAWANSKAMALAGITRDTPDPAGGRIERDADGNPTGVFIDSAMQLVSRIVPAANDAERRAALDAALLRLSAAGLTSVHDAGVGVEQDALLREYADRGRLTVRVYGMIRGNGEAFDHLSRNGPLMTYGDDRYALRAVKLFSDGALGSRGAALMAPYSDAPGTRGLLFHDDAAMAAMVRKAASRGYQVNVHAIGDAGNRQVLDAFSALPADQGAPALRHRIEHAQVVAWPDDIARFARLGVIASMQPIHATSDMNMAEDRVGPRRIRGAYAWRRFLRQGARVACGSDFPVEAPDPFWGIHAAVNRQDHAGKPAGGWYRDQAMSLKEALKCFTLDAAFAAHQEDRLGTLEAGKWADFIVTDRDPFAIPARSLYQVKVMQTWVAGKAVFSRQLVASMPEN